MDVIVNIGSALCLFLGSFLCFSGGVGIIRFPDFYTRMHAVGVTDTLGAGMILLGLMLQNPGGLVVLKLLLILVMTIVTGPVASHALAKAAFRNDLVPLSDKNENNGGVAPSNS
ncbi:MAG: monovalent cation/H(+) antiporter subunit G [Gammaproteobacteria bacterium]|nr:monovalent cation/H(+) antiporter subunit G [Gammaproteobacteria bacterium]